MTEELRPEAPIPAVETSLSPALFAAQERNAAILSSISEIMVKTAKAIGESQTELLRLEAEQASKVIVPPKFDKDAGAAVSAYGAQVHESSEKLINHMRVINDLVIDCAWQLFKVYADAFRQLPKP